MKRMTNLLLSVWLAGLAWPAAAEPAPAGPTPSLTPVVVKNARVVLRAKPGADAEPAGNGGTDGFTVELVPFDG